METPRLKVGDRVCHHEDTQDLGTVIELRGNRNLILWDSDWAVDEVTRTGQLVVAGKFEPFVVKTGQRYDQQRVQELKAQLRLSPEER